MLMILKILALLASTVVFVQSTQLPNEGQQPGSSSPFPGLKIWRPSFAAGSGSGSGNGSGSNSDGNSSPSYDYPDPYNASVCSDSASKTPDCQILTTATGHDTEPGDDRAVFLPVFYIPGKTWTCVSVHDLGPIARTYWACDLSFNLRKAGSLRTFFQHFGTLHLYREDEEIRHNGICFLPYPDPKTGLGYSLDVSFSCRADNGTIGPDPNTFTMAGFAMPGFLKPNVTTAANANADQAPKNIELGGRPVVQFS